MRVASFLLFGVLGFGQGPTLNSMLEAVVLPSHYDGVPAPVEGDYEVQVTNLSGKSIAAFKIEVTAASGEKTREVGPGAMDLMPGYVAVRLGGNQHQRYNPGGPFGAGEQIALPIPGKYADERRLAVRARGIVFDDNTVEGDREWAATIFKRRAAEAEQMDRALEMVRNPSGSLGLRDQIRTWTEALPPDGTAGQMLAALLTISLTDGALATRFELALSYFSEYAAEFRAHSRMVDSK